MTPALTRHPSGRMRRAIAGIILFVAGTSQLPGRDLVEPPAPLAEYAVKAALLFNLAKYADWPSTAFATRDAPIVIGVLGSDPFGAVLDRVVRGRVVNGRPIVIRRASGISELKGAHLVFISPDEPHAAQECAVLEELSILTVSDSGPNALFTAFNFVMEGDRIVFTVD